MIEPLIKICSMMINDKFSKTYAAELSIGTGEIHFKKLKVLTNQKKYSHLTSVAMVRCTKLEFFKN